ncbi:hypothetical protein J5N97_028512 [Dioscorea zingiberensis]|uniref:Uncharacterized protein n=1 Tax=Dioscorea zingiberensis TaxID=325984 RepID=A0A9D5H4X5_9LILI|nr:hypothetical protein J5N97_028512 [Dioscorea zingiberensis]
MLELLSSISTAGEQPSPELFFERCATLLKFPGLSDNVFTYLVAGLGVGFFTICIGSRVDVVKSTMMGYSAYKSTMDCFMETL